MKGPRTYTHTALLFPYFQKRCLVQVRVSFLNSTKKNELYSGDNGRQETRNYKRVNLHFLQNNVTRHEMIWKKIHFYTFSMNPASPRGEWPVLLFSPEIERPMTHSRAERRRRLENWAEKEGGNRFMSNTIGIQTPYVDHLLPLLYTFFLQAQFLSVPFSRGKKKEMCREKRRRKYIYCSFSVDSSSPDYYIFFFLILLFVSLRRKYIVVIFLH